jgi:hypothetical protein
MAKKDFKGSIGKTNIPAKLGIKGLFSNSSDDALEETITPVIPVQNEPLEVRQTFIVKNSHLEKLKDYVHFRRQQGHSFYTQKEALNDALDAFFEMKTKIPTRPDFIKEAEQQRANRIKKSL